MNMNHLTWTELLDALALTIEEFTNVATDDEEAYILAYKLGCYETEFNHRIHHLVENIDETR